MAVHMPLRSTPTGATRTQHCDPRPGIARLPPVHIDIRVPQVIETPGFVPVGTNGALKGMSNEQASESGVQLMFANTYHLLVHPGAETVEAAGGLHAFMGRTGPIITDSGGFQVPTLMCMCMCMFGEQFYSCPPSPAAPPHPPPGFLARCGHR